MNNNDVIRKARKRLLALSGKTRGKILKHLLEKGSDNTPLGIHKELKIGKERVNFDLKRMIRAGVLHKEREGRRVYYTVNTVLVRHLEQMAREITEK